jgi:CBS domain containing-hemolysin-like protein
VTAVTSLVFWLIVAAAADLLVAVGQAALINSRLTRLQEWASTEMPGAGLAARVAANSTRLIASMRAAHGLLRLAVVALIAGIFQAAAPRPEPLLVVGILIAGGIGFGLMELLCENLVLRAPERWGLRLAPLAAVIVWLFAPIGWLLERLAAALAGPGAGRQHTIVTEEAIMTLVDAGEEGGVIEEEEKEMIYSIFRLGDTLARELMIPRLDIVAFDISTPLGEAADRLLEAGHSRAPVYSGTIDNVVGLLYAKDLLAAQRGDSRVSTVGELIRDAYYVPEAKRVDDLLEEMQAKRVHMAIVVDEYGGTAGLVTIEDIVEEIVGEIRDEYDATEEPLFQRHPDGSTIFSGRIALDDVERILGVELPNEGSDSLGGLVYSRLGRVPTPGEAVEAGGLRMVVEQVSGRRIRKVRVAAPAAASPESEEHGNPTSSTR